jgi:hypothetical protein
MGSGSEWSNLSGRLPWLGSHSPHLNPSRRLRVRLKANPGPGAPAPPPGPSPSIVKEHEPACRLHCLSGGLDAGLNRPAEPLPPDSSIRCAYNENLCELVKGGSFVRSPREEPFAVRRALFYWGNEIWELGNGAFPVGDETFSTGKMIFLFMCMIGCLWEAEIPVLRALFPPGNVPSGVPRGRRRGGNAARRTDRVPQEVGNGADRGGQGAFPRGNGA